MSKPKVKVDVYSDTVCPWCCVGKSRLERAIGQLKDKAEFEVRWHPYQLMPDAPQEGVNKLEMYNAKFGAARVASMMPMMAKTFEEEFGGKLPYSVGGLTGNTFDSHRLLSYAGSKFGAEKQNELVQALFRAYFSEEKYINDREVLVAAAESVGIPGARDYLADPNNGRAEVLKELSSAPRGMSGVPHFVIGDQIHLGGAQPPAQFVAAFNQLLGGRA